MTELRVKVSIPETFQVLRAPARATVLYGGRASAKSWSVARYLVLMAAQTPIRILCGREFQTSIRDSVPRLLGDQIQATGLSSAFSVTQKAITSSVGSEFLFKGIRHNIQEIKSTEGIDICWVEEAQMVSADSWQILTPTIRKPGSRIIVTFNPDAELDPTYQRWVMNPPPGTVTKKVSWRDNPHFSPEMREEMRYLRRVDPDAYSWVWEGNCRKSSAAQVLSGKLIIEDFTPGAGWDGPYQGADWGFSQDPTALVRLWIHDRVLYVEHEVWAIGLDIDKTPEAFDKMEGARLYVTRADSARPETNSYMQRHGYPKVEGVEKWPNSVEEGIRFLRQFERIVIHPRCVHAVEEGRLWSYKKDRLTGDVLPDLVDKHNHIWDAVRYALQPMIRASGTGLLDYYRQQVEAKGKK